MAAPRSATSRRTGIVSDQLHPIVPIISAIDEAPFSDEIVRFCPREISASLLSLVHSPALIDQVYRAALATNESSDPASRFEPRLCRAALATAGCVVAAVDAVMSNDPASPDVAFAIVSSPGHHATADRALGHSLLNNVAIAARYAQRTFGLVRVMILDWDAHHASGTEAIFADDPSVLTVSLHQWPLYPGTGWYTDVGGAAFNIPLPPGAGDALYGAAFARIVEPIAEQFAPELILIAAGLDCHAAHPLTDLLVSFDGLRAMALSARRIADRHGNGRLVLTLEGGYHPSTPPWLVAGILATLGDLPVSYRDPFAPKRSVVPPSHEKRLREIAEALVPYWRL